MGNCILAHMEQRNKRPASLSRGGAMKKYIEKGDVVRIKDLPLSIHNARIKGSIGIVVGDDDDRRKYKYRQLAVSIPNYRIVHLVPMHLEKVNENR
jgi:hypothetical protein